LLITESTTSLLQVELYNPGTNLCLTARNRTSYWMHSQFPKFTKSCNKCQNAWITAYLMRNNFWPFLFEKSWRHLKYFISEQEQKWQSYRLWWCYSFLCLRSVLKDTLLSVAQSISWIRAKIIADRWWTTASQAAEDIF